MEDYYEGSLSESDPCPRQMPPLLPPKNLGSKPGTNIRQPPQQQVQSQERQQFSNPPVTPFITQNQQQRQHSSTPPVTPLTTQNQQRQHSSSPPATAVIMQNQQRQYHFSQSQWTAPSITHQQVQQWAPQYQQVVSSMSTQEQEEEFYEPSTSRDTPNTSNNAAEQNFEMANYIPPTNQIELDATSNGPAWREGLNTTSHVTADVLQRLNGPPATRQKRPLSTTDEGSKKCYFTVRFIILMLIFYIRTGFAHYVKKSLELLKLQQRETIRMVEAIAASSRVLANAVHVESIDVEGFSFPIDSEEKLNELEQAISSNTQTNVCLVNSSFYRHLSKLLNCSVY